MDDWSWTAEDPRGQSCIHSGSRVNVQCHSDPDAHSHNPHHHDAEHSSSGRAQCWVTQ